MALEDGRTIVSAAAWQEMQVGSEAASQATAFLHHSTPGRRAATVPWSQ